MRSRRRRGCSRLKSCTIGHAADVLLRVGVDLARWRRGCGGSCRGRAAEDAGDVEDDGDDGEREQGQRPAHPQHDDDDEGEHEDVFKDGEDAGGEHFVERVDVGGDAGDELADGVVVEEAGVHALQVAEDLAAQIEHDLLAGPLHEVGLQELQDVGEQERGEVEQAELGDAGHGLGAEVVGEPGELLGRVAVM